MAPTDVHVEVKLTFPFSFLKFLLIDSVKFDYTTIIFISSVTGQYSILKDCVKKLVKATVL